MERMLSKISAARREELSRNPSGLSVGRLQSLIPEIDQVDVDNSIADGPEPARLRLVAWNMLRGRHWRLGAEFLRQNALAQDPDILLVSEMDWGMARSDNEHTVRELAHALEMNYAYGVEFLELGHGDAEERSLYGGENEWGFHGNAILARRPLSGARIVRFPGIEKWYASDQKRLGGRMAVLAEISLGGREVTLVATHLENGIDERNCQKRRLEMRQLLTALEGRDAVLLGGDLNTIPQDPLFDRMRDAGFLVAETNELERGTCQGLDATGEVFLKPYHIDYLCVRGFAVAPGAAPAVVPAVWDGKLLSDHAAVTAEVLASGRP